MLKYDKEIIALSEYVVEPILFDDKVYETACLCLADALGCAILSLKYPACTKLLGPIVPGLTVPTGCRVPGTSFLLDPVSGAFNIGTMIRWLDYNDTFLAAEWGHPSDNLGGLLAVADSLVAEMSVKELLTALIKAYEIQGNLALANSFNKIGLDHVIYVKLATAAVATSMLGGNQELIAAALSQVLLDSAPLRAYRHAPQVGSRKSWAAGDATSRGVFLALLTLRGESGYPKALTAPKWGLYDVLFNGEPFKFERPLGSYVMENILFKVAFPAEFHAQTAVECAIKLHPAVKDRLEEIEKIEISTQEAAMRIIDKRGPLTNAADRDHCMQYMVAVGLLQGRLTAADYEEKGVDHDAIEKLRNKMVMQENVTFSLDYLSPNKRSIANSLTIYFKGGERLGPLVIEFPLGHQRRRAEAAPLLFDKLYKNLNSHYSLQRSEELLSLFYNQERLLTMSVKAFMAKWF